MEEVIADAEFALKGLYDEGDSFFVPSREELHNLLVAVYDAGYINGRRYEHEHTLKTIPV